MYLTLYVNEKGEVLEHPGITMLGRSGSEWIVPARNDMIPLPRGSSLVVVPGHIPVGIDEREKLTYFETDPLCSSQKAYTVAALLPQGFTRTLLPACVSPSNQGTLPLFGYAAVGFKNEKIYVAAVQTDKHRKWHPAYYNTEGLPERIAKMLKKYPHNRIYRQLARCSMEYGCFTAQNIFYQRWEGGLPTMNFCNANCIGCISESHVETASPQNRLDFIPDVKEIAELGIEHLANAREAILSFGQGCEGEPSLNARQLAQAIKMMRAATNRGTININTNAGYTKGIKKICDAGINAMRVTIFSCHDKNYNTYHCPRNYCLADVEESIKYAKDKGVQVSLNLLTFPGFTDREGEKQLLLDFVMRNQVDMIQLRNLNFDPDYLFMVFPGENQVMGINKFIATLKRELPRVKIGSYTHPVFKSQE